MIRQLALHIPHRAAMDAEDFLVAPSNAEAVAWIDRWPDWSAPALILHGPSGCGKTHLLQVWRARAGAPAWPAAALGDADPPGLLGRGNACALDDVDEGVDETALLHLYNMVAERRGTLLLTGASPPAHWKVSLPDLRSRLLAAAVTSVEPPDESLMVALLVKLFADRQIQVRQDVVDYLVVRLERSFAAVRRTVEEIDRAALAARRPITVPLVRSVILGSGGFPGSET